MKQSIVTLNSTDVRELYESAFPAAERVPFETLVKTCENGARFTQYRNDELLGLSYIIELDRALFLFFLAVNESHRGGGIGGAILDSIISASNKPIILDIEETSNLPETDVRVRRKNFYLRHGFSDTGFRYEYRSVKYELLGLNADFDGQYKKLVMDAWKSVE